MDIKVTVDVSSALAELESMSKRVEKNVDKELNEFCKKVVSGAKLRAPVDTGKMKWSIRQVRNRATIHSIEVGADYSSFVEYGTSRMKAQPFVTPAINVHKPALEKNLTKILDK